MIFLQTKYRLTRKDRNDTEVCLTVIREDEE